MTAAQPTLPPPVARSLAIWHEMIAARSFDRLASITAEGVLFRSPAFFNPYPGKEALGIVLSAAMTVFEDFAYHRILAGPDGHDVMLEFSAHIGGTRLKGIDLIRFDSAGHIVEFEVMVRPLNGLTALAKAMAERAGPRLKALMGQGAR